MDQIEIATLRAAARDLWSDGRGWVLIGVASGWFLSLGVRLIFPALLPYLQETFALGLSVSGLLITVLWFSYAIGQFPGGIVGDRLGEGNALVLSTIGSGVVVTIIALSQTAWMLFAVTAVFGLVTAVFGPARFTILSAIYDDRDGTAVGLTLSAGEAGNAVLPVVAGVLAAFASWRLGFGFTVPFFFLVAVLLIRVVPGRLSTDSAVDTLSISTFRYVARGIATRVILLVSSVHILLFFVYQGFTGFYPTYLVATKGFSPSLAAGLFGLFFVAGVVVQPIAGAAGDRYGTRRALLAVIGIATVALLALPFVDEVAGVVAVTLVASAVLGVTPLTQTFLVNTLPADMKGSGLGLVRTIMIAIGATGPLFVGVVADFGYFDVAYFGLAMLAGTGLVLTLFVPPE